jgi:hypothetical protein
MTTRERETGASALTPGRITEVMIGAAPRQTDASMKRLADVRAAPAARVTR